MTDKLRKMLRLVMHIRTMSSLFKKKKVTKIVKEFPCILHPPSPNVSILHN